MDIGGLADLHSPLSIEALISISLWFLREDPSGKRRNMGNPLSSK
jgi:hypothetical protein